jgi:hypothetical protein
VGGAVSDGSGLAVSVGAGVSVNVGESVTGTVCVADGTVGVTVSVIGENAVSVGTGVSEIVVAIGVEVNWQAREVRIHKKGRIKFRLMG